MDEPVTAAPAPDQPISYSLRQIIAVMTAVGAGIALFYPLLSPPPGSSGLSWAMLPAGVLAAALWFCSNDTSARLATYAVVASLFSVAFGGIAFSQTDWLFGHGLGMPQLTVASFVSSLIGALTGGVWIMSKSAARQQASASDSVADGGKSPPVRWTGAAAVVPLTLFSCLSVLGGLPSLPRYMRRLDLYIQQRQVDAQIFGRSSQRTNDPVMETRPEIPGIVARHIRNLDDSDTAVRRQAASSLRAVIRNVREESPKARLFDQSITKDALIRRLDDDDAVVHTNVAMAIVELKDQADRQDRLRAIAVLGEAKRETDVVAIHAQPAPPDGAALETPQGTLDFQYALVTLQRVLDDKQDHESRIAAIRALGRIGPAGGTSVAARLAVELERGEPSERAAAAEALAAMGPAAQPFRFEFGRAWQRRLLTVEQAQLLYKIDPQAAALFNIPRP